MTELPRYLYFIIAFICLLFVGNIILLDFFFVMQKGDLVDFQTRLAQLSGQKPKETVITQTVPAPTPTFETCPSVCLTAIDTAVKTVNATRANPVVTTVPATMPTIKGEYFIPLGTGSVLNSEATSTNWKTIESAQATFDASSYGTIKSATLEVFLRVAATGEVHARLLDSTTPAIQWTSESSTNATTSTYKSAPLSLAGGSKTYKIQMYSTLSTGYLDQARIRIVTQ